MSLDLSRQARRLSLASVLTLALAAPGLACAAPAPAAGAPPASAWADLAKLPDWGGMWVPDVRDQMRKATANRPPWTPKVAAEMKKMEDEENAGRPFLVLAGCFPHGMPAFMLITHNAIEVLFTPGRVTILGESDGNRLRRIYTDGRKHSEDPDPTMHGESIGHWEGDTLVVDTIGVMPQAYIATTEGVGVPNDGDMHIVERIHLADPDTLAFDMEITAPKVLTQTWKTTRIFKRMRGPGSDIIEGQCVQGQFTTGKDANGHDVYIPIPQHEDGSIRAKAQ